MLDEIMDAKIKKHSAFAQNLSAYTKDEVMDMMEDIKALRDEYLPKASVELKEFISGLHPSFKNINVTALIDNVMLSVDEIRMWVEQNMWTNTIGINLPDEIKENIMNLPATNPAQIILIRLYSMLICEQVNGMKFRAMIYKIYKTVDEIRQIFIAYAEYLAFTK